VVLDYFDLVFSLSYEFHVAKINVVKVLGYYETQTMFVSYWALKESATILSWGSYSNFQLPYNCTFKGILRDLVTIERENQVYLIVSVSSHGSSVSAEALLESKLTKSGYGELEKSSTKYGRTFVLKLEASGSWVIHQIIYGHDFGNLGTLKLFHSSGDIRECAVTIAGDEDGTRGRALVLCFNPLRQETSTKYNTDIDAGMEIYQTLPVVKSRSSANRVNS